LLIFVNFPSITSAFQIYCIISFLFNSLAEMFLPYMRHSKK
jgi:hypothetical protein